MKQNIYNFLRVLIIAGFLFSFTKAFSQDDELREKIENIKLEKMTKKLELDDATKTTFTEKYKSFGKSLRELNLKRAKIYRKMNENLESGNGLDTLTEQILKTESEIYESKISFITDLKTILTAKQFAGMIIFERKFTNELRKLLKGSNKEERKNKKEKNE